MEPERKIKDRRAGRDGGGGSRPGRRRLWALGLFALAAYLTTRRSPGRRPAREAVMPPDLGPEEPAQYERKDASVGWVFGVVAILAVSGIAMHFLLAGLLTRWNEKPATTDNWQPAARPAGGLVAPGVNFPRLQVSPPFDLQQFRAREEARLNAYGWIDRASGVAHIPIQEAMDLVLKRGLPVRAQTGTVPEELGPSAYELQLQRVKQLPGKETP